MKKEEILAKAQAERVDEREIFINDRSIKWTYLVMIISAGIFMIVRSTRDMPITDLCATVCLAVAAGNIYRSIKTKDKWYLIAGIVMAVSGIFTAVRFFMGH